MDTKHVRAAVAVVRHGSFTVAARELFMAQSTMSRQIAALEREVGAELFVRGARRVELTVPGEAFLTEAREILAAVERAERAARAAARRGRDAP
jgi:LysR family hca operon transcriptional activator